MTVQHTAAMAVNQVPFQSASSRLFAAGANAPIAQHEQVFGPVALERISTSFISVVEASGLTGRGGAAFASWRKLSATDRSQRETLLAGKAVVVANGAEGEPLSFKDKTLLANAPHLVIDGLLIAGRAVAASQLYMYVTPAVMPAVQAAVAGRGDARAIKVIQAPESFIAGEASAVVNRIANGMALPLDKRRRLSESGVKGHPTLVLNVETLAHMALIARYGAAWFRSRGSDRDPGTRLVSLSGDCHEQVLEVQGDASIGGILSNAGVDFTQVNAVLVGGYHGQWVRSLEQSLSPVGPVGGVVRPGAGVLHVLSNEHCGLDVTARILNYLVGESAKQCGPCMFGLPAMARVLTAIASGDSNPRLPGELERLSKLVISRGACHHPDGTARLLGSALEIFSDDVRAHLAGHCTRISSTDRRGA